LQLDHGGEEKKAEEQFADVSKRHLVWDCAFISQYEIVLFWNCLNVMPVLQSEVDDPTYHEEAKEYTEHGNCKVSVAPRVWECLVVELPKAKENESHETVPNALIDGTKPYSVLVYFFGKSAQFPKSVYLLVLQQHN
jgi:hypothetical protein